MNRMHRAFVSQSNGRKFWVSVSLCTQDRAVSVLLQVLQLHFEVVMTTLGKRKLGEKGTSFK